MTATVIKKPCLFLLWLAMGLSGACSTGSVKTETKVALASPLPAKERFLYISPLGTADDASAQWTKARTLFSANLKEAGFTIVEEAGKAHLTAFLDYRINEGRKKTRSVKRFAVGPFAGQKYEEGRYYEVAGSREDFSAGRALPGIGYYYEQSSFTVFKHEAVFELVDGRGARLFLRRAWQEDEEEKAPLPPLLMALLEDIS